MKAKWSVLALYENAQARQLAVQFCDGLVQRFWTEFGFELNWCAWSELSSEVGQRAREAGLIIVALGGRGNIPLHIKDWLELTLQNRAEREGVLVGLPGLELGCDPEAAATQMYLRKLAHHAGMDYLTAVPESLPTRVPESADAYNERATQVTSVLDKILNSTSPPPRML